MQFHERCAFTLSVQNVVETIYQTVGVQEGRVESCYARGRGEVAAAAVVVEKRRLLKISCFNELVEDRLRKTEHREIQGQLGVEENSIDYSVPRLSDQAV